MACGVIQVTSLWKSESEDQHEAILIVWNLDPVPRGRASLTADIEAKLRELTDIDQDYHNWS